MSAQVRPTIVVGIDGSRDGLLALDWAADLAARRHWAVRAVHVADEDRPARPLVAAPDIEDGAEVLEDAADELTRLGFTDATLEVRHGHPAEVLLDLSRTAELLVIGRRGGGGFAELTLGSTSQVCTALAQTSLVVVPDSWKREEVELGMIVVGVDGSHACQAALGFAFEMAAERGAEVVIVHVPREPEDFPPPGVWINPEDTPWQHDARRLITESVAGWPDKYPEVVFRTHYRPGHPVQVLAQHSKAADLVVVGGVGRSRFTPLRLGSVSRGLLHHTQCPVAIVHTEATA
ncbi:nucleotide-binding universal stress UspA family protein [Kribbella orskensis]|uniref:Nucleotide-binding universal stress UspA family protein n=1 Tax=Kribbella orskensis TaxID=2512216 RepID=A0ABY2BAK5_9ACTN|nr:MULTISPECIES: universal stress protein [Kribbella]TCN31158.1 nucleotide-binding universal stress UspA family protein [Kribbella sp. VKM Ac-2500]TCO11664.1 nucleotide-binding universal stress UspA family protein [Kribbella orskensis]